MSVKITTKHPSYSLVTFVTHKRFAVLFFLPSCCVNSLLITTHHPLSIKSGPITAHSTFTVRNICIFASQIQRNYNVSYIIQNDGIDPMDEFMKLLKTLYTFTVPLCSTVQHLLGALSLQSVTSSLVLFTSCKLIKKSLISGR